MATGSALSKTTSLNQDLSGSDSDSSTSYATTSGGCEDKIQAREFCEQFVGPMPIDTFFSEFVPKATTERPVNKITFPHSFVLRNEDAFICAIEGSGLCPKLKFINNAASRKDRCYGLKSDISIYPDYRLSDDPRIQRFLDWKAVDVWVEKKKSNDPFPELTKLKTEEESEKDLESRACTDSTYSKICGPLAAYAPALERSKFRVFSFAVVLFGDTGRLLRWDRSGAIYTESFNWPSQPDTLFEFLWRLNFLSDVDRGCDTTVTSVGEEEAEVALSKLTTYKGLENVQTTDLLKLLVHDDCDVDDGQFRCYIASSAVWSTQDVFGRCTLGYIAYDVATSNLVFLKDFWRTDRPGVQKEGDVYRELHDAQVPNIPVFGPAGDVPLSPDHVNVLPRAVQRTKTQDYVKGSGLGHEWCLGRPRVFPQVHYRMVLETLGQPLKTFKSTRQLCEVIRDAILAHSVAYEKTRILHRDVSAGNILITEEDSGILIDWDLSKKVMPEVDAKPRKYSRTGTWQFMSAARLIDPITRRHNLADDLESFLWVLLYQVTKHRNTACMDLSSEMWNIFNSHTTTNRDGDPRGGVGKLCFLRGLELHPEVVKLFVKTPCRNIIEELRDLFHDLYLNVGLRPPYPIPVSGTSEHDPLADSGAESTQDPRTKAASERLSSSEWVLNMVNGHLASKWVIDDDRGLDPSEIRRKRYDKEYWGGDFNKMRKCQLPPSKSKPSTGSRWWWEKHSADT
ncbi:hypothetical protein BC827DRAFT_1267471 [Russula dissimulans]|nr:hypothetical protein BC827DRAFT_1267471 [Russula dissimulans]